MICAWIGEAAIYAGIGIRTLSRWPQLCWFSEGVCGFGMLS